MKNVFLIFIMFFTFVLLCTKNTYATYDPLSVANNKYGIHIMDENDIEDASYLVNSNGGDWGYATIVIRADERKLDRWQKVFDKMRRLHLIPIVRIATKQRSSESKTSQIQSYWEKPDTSDIDNWVYFLNSLNWVVVNRYVIVGNEPNHAVEWGGEINPNEYSKYLMEFSKKLKDASKDFYVLQAGFDASAPNSKGYMDEETFLSQMFSYDSNIFDYIDGWTSHSYPNPAFSGSPYEDGRGTIKTYLWELDLLKKLGVTKEIPVFITETGWSTANLNENTISENYRHAFDNVWTDRNIVAITPFVLNYTGEPFNVFSWKNIDGSFKSFYNTVAEDKKVEGKPYQRSLGKIISKMFPNVLRVEENKLGLSLLKNTGQTIWIKNTYNYSDITGFGKSFVVPIFSNVEPNHAGIMMYLPYNSLVK